MTFSKHVPAKVVHYKIWLHLCRAIYRLVLKGRRCPFEIACEENLELEEHTEKITFLILHFYTVTG